MAVQPNLGFDLFSPPPPGISSLFLTSTSFSVQANVIL